MEPSINRFFPGLLLIALGLLFLAQNLGGWQLNNWWALFILIPAAAAFLQGYQLAQQDGRWSQRALATAFSGSFPLLVAIVFLLNWDWGKVWPLFIVLVGLGLLIRPQNPAK